MSDTDENPTAVCPCETFVHPAVVSNPPGRAAIAYRAGDYTAFRHALLQARAGETELSRTDGSRIVQVWRPGGTGDLAVQLIEWWAYLADVLTFYNERVASQAYLRTAELPESVSRLIRLLGYRPRPALGATGVLAALANGPKPFTLPAGFQVQSKPGPGEQPQVFELGSDTVVGAVPTGPATGPQGVASAAPAADPAAASAQMQSSRTVALQGASTSLKQGDRLMFWRGGASPSGELVTVAAVSQQRDPQAGLVTQVAFGADGDLSAITDITAWRVLKSEQSVSVWQYPADESMVVRPDPGQAANSMVDLQAVVRGLHVGDPLLFESVNTVQIASLVSVSEVVWYANPANYNPPAAPSKVDPSVPPPDPRVTLPIPIPHTRLTFNPALAGFTDDAPSRAQTSVWYGWKDVGTPLVLAATSIGGVAGPAAANTGSAPATVTLPFASAASSFLPAAGSAPVLLEDAVGNGVPGTLDENMALTLTPPVPSLQAPFRLLFNLLSVTRGKTVGNEVLGNGNAALAGQDFTLQNAPVTYLQDPASVSGDNYSSTVRVWVNGLEWMEARSFYGAAASDQIFVTREDEGGATHVVFGDGEQGARLPTGVNNIVAAYRYGGGAQNPAAGSLTVVLQPQPGLKAIRNPVRVGGGADPDPPAKIRQLAPRSVLTFGRAISLDDYETIAAQAPEVARAKAYFTFDPFIQRPRVKLWVGDDAAAVKAAGAALAGAADPNCAPGIALANAIEICLSLTLVIDPRLVPASVYQAVHDALLDPDAGLLGVNVVGIGQVFYDSQIYAACLAVPGVQAVNGYCFSLGPPVETPACDAQPRHDPGEGGFFSLPDDGAHLTILPPLAP